jgi:hypothetical protein
LYYGGLNSEGNSYAEENERGVRFHDYRCVADRWELLNRNTVFRL